MIDFEILRHDHNLFSLQTFEVSIDMTYTIHTFLIKQKKNHENHRELEALSKIFFGIALPFLRSRHITITYKKTLSEIILKEKYFSMILS